MNVLNINHMTRIGLTVFSLLMLAIVAACGFVVDIPVTEPTPIPTDSLIPGRYDDPEGLFSVALPENWKVTQADGYALLSDPDGTIKVYVQSVPGDDPEYGIQAAWDIVDSSFALKPGKVETPSREGIEKVTKIFYQTDSTRRAVSAIGQLVQGRVYTILIDGAADAVARSDSELTMIENGYDIKAVKKIDLSKVQPKKFNQQMLAELEAYIKTVMEREEVLGAEVAIVQDGKVIYEEGFGVRELGKSDPVTPETLMMVGSTTKAMTTMMMASVVDDEKMTWDTPAVSILPTFAVSDPNLTSKITVRHLVCNCTGAERRDIEMYFPTRPTTAEGMVESLRTFAFTGTFGQSYQYSNQMVAAGGYVAAHAADGSGDLYADYLAQMQQRVFNPIGMTSSTFDFQQALSNPNHASPHARHANGQLVTVPIEYENNLIHVAPAGGLWSNVQDMARYLATQMNQGVTEEGTRVVSAENLKVTWQPQVQEAPNAWYALGWLATDYKKARVLNHNGGTAGFNSNVTFLPDAKLGIVILTNAQDNRFFLSSIMGRMFEMAYDQPEEIGPALAKRSAEAKKALQEQIAQLPPSFDPAEVAPYLGIRNNPSLGDVTLALEGEKLVLDAHIFKTELRNAGNGIFLLWDPPLVGLYVKLDKNAAGQHTWQLVSEDPSQPETYPFTENNVGSLEEIELGGVKQWILINGEDRNKPILLWLHGGPGSPLMPTAYHFDTELNKHFVVVHWDQRGAGKSYDPALTPEMLTTEQYIADTHDLVQYLRQRFNVPKIYLIGHSWGSTLGALTVARYPDLFYAYVGVSQPVSVPEGYKIVYPRLLDQARATGNQEALQELEALGPPPWSSTESLMIFSKWNGIFRGSLWNITPEQLDAITMQSPIYTSEDFETAGQGLMFSTEVMFNQLLQINLFEQAPRLDVPVYFFMGRHDGQSPDVLIERYYNALEAPADKHLVWFEESAHAAMYEEPAKFNQEMLHVLEETYPLTDTIAGSD